jgi:acetyl esterase/lipase
MKRLKASLIWTTIVILAATGLAPSRQAEATPVLQVAPGGAVQRNVTYCTAGGVDLQMDVYPPAIIRNPQSAIRNPQAPAPAIIYVHGGSWTSGDKAEIGQGAADLNARGYLVVSIDYRLAPQYKWPAQIEDVKCAVRSLRAHAGTYNIDPNRIGVWGSSAGGYLVALAGLATSSAGFDTQGGYLDQSSRVQAVVDMFGPTDLLAYKPDQLAIGLGQVVFGYSQGGPTDLLAKASPITYVSKDAPPFLILQGDRDALVPPSQSQELNDKLLAAGASSTLVLVKNAGHSFVPVTGNLKDLSPSIDQIKAMIPDFFDRTLGSGQVSSQQFPQTGKSVQGKFLSYWQDHGGLAQFGYPISDELQERSFTDGKTYTVQYFERARFELHPENSPPSDVLLSLLGVSRYNQQYPNRAGSGPPSSQTPNQSPGSILFEQTGKRVGGKFLAYWQTHGGLAQFGYPISDELTEVSPLDGKPYRVQYFERALFEYHPENAPPYDVLLAQLGRMLYDK